MSVRRMSLAALLLALLLALSTRSARADEVLIFGGTGEMVIPGQKIKIANKMVDQSFTYCGFKSTDSKSASSRPMVLFIPNAEAKKDETPKPKKELIDVVNKLTVGDYVKIDHIYSASLKNEVLTSIEPYEAKPAELASSGYIFAKTFEKPSGKMTTTTVVLTRFGKEFSFEVPVVHKDKGVVEPDADILAALGKVSEGNSVWVQAKGKYLTLIEPFNEPKVGTLDKKEDYYNESDTDKKFKIPQAEFTEEGKSPITLKVQSHVNGKVVTYDRIAADELRKLKEKTVVKVYYHDDGSDHYIREIVAEPTKKPEKTSPEKSNKKSTAAADKTAEKAKGH